MSDATADAKAIFFEALDRKLAERAAPLPGRSLRR